jgi:DNA replication protein DnaC
VLFLDDLGTRHPAGVNAASEDRIEIWYKIIGHREAKQLPTFITTNLNREERLKHFGDRLCSRLDGLCHVVNMVGTDRRSQMRLVK